MTILKEPYQIRCTYCNIYLSFGLEDIIPGEHRNHSIPHIKCANCHKMLPVLSTKNPSYFGEFMLSDKELDAYQN